MSQKILFTCEFLQWGNEKSALSDRSCNAFLDQFLISKNLRLPALSSKCCGILQEIQKS